MKSLAHIAALPHSAHRLKRLPLLRSSLVTRFLLCLLFHVAKCPPWPPEEWRDDDKVKPIDLDRVEYFRVPHYKYKRARNKPRMNRAVMLRMAKMANPGGTKGGAMWHELLAAQHAVRAIAGPLAGGGAGAGGGSPMDSFLPPKPPRAPSPPPEVKHQEIMREGPFAAQVAKARK